MTIQWTYKPSIFEFKQKEITILNYNKTVEGTMN
jgi:hypothetical protein